MTWTTRPRSRAGPLAAITYGEGPVVLLIHGVGLRAEAWCAQIDDVSRACRVVAVDIPGHGQSSALPDTAELADFTDRIVAALDEPAIVVGHSFGAMIALDMAIRHKARVKGVVALNAVYRRDAAAQAAVIARANNLDGKMIADPTATLERWFGGEPSPESNACKDWLQTVDPVGYRKAYRIFAREDGPMEADLKTLDCPALFVTGEQEPNSTPAMSKNMAALVASGRAEIFANAAHMLPMTHAAQLSGLLTTFVANTSERM
jgi:pimeloyl-ACP methyl ester carboxylesterase